MRYQVHGLDGGVYAILSDAQVLINARFVFVESGVCPPVSVVTACFSHPGSYFGQLALRTAQGGRLLLTPGAAAAGYASVVLDGVAIDVSQPHASTTIVSNDGSIRLTIVDAWRVSITAGNYELQVDSSDHFVNIAAMRVLDWHTLTNTLQPHGLLGQTWRRHPHSAALEVSEVEGSVDDYLEADDDMFGANTLYNRFGME